MKVNINKTSDNERELEISADKEVLAPIVRQVFNRLRPDVKAPGFRPGKAPDSVIERELGASQVQQEVVQAAVNNLFTKAAKENDLAPLESPRISLTKFVPYSELEFSAKFEVMPEIKLADYKKIKKEKGEVKVTPKEIDKVVETVRERVAEKKEVKRAAKEGDEVVIDFKGKLGGKPLPNADGTDFPLKLGSGQFIPGFEEKLIGLKPGEEKEFKLKFPKEYSEKTLAGKEATFTVKVKTVNELVLPEADDELAAKAGPFKSLAELKESIENSIKGEKEKEVSVKLERDVVEEVVSKSKLSLPLGIVEKQLDNLIARLQQDLEYREETLKDYLEREGKSRQDLEKELQPEAEKRVKTALVLTKIAEEEKLEVSPDELEVRIQILKGQYRDEQVQAELDKPAVRSEIKNQLLTEKVVEKLIEYATK